MKNYVQPGNTITLPAPADVIGGDGVIVGTMFGIAAGDAAKGEDMDLTLVGVFELPKVAAEAADIGAPIYWDAAEKLVTIDDGEGEKLKIGVAVAAAANPSAYVNVRLNGVF